MSAEILSLIALEPLLAMTGGGTGEIIRVWENPGGIALRFVLVLFFVFLNGFFVAAEFALVKVRYSQLDTLAEEGKGSAKLARSITKKLDAYLSACQLGITLASLALGWIGQPFVAKLVQPALVMLNLGDTWVLWISIILAFAFNTFMHVVIGEQIPKLVAIRKEVATSLIVARPLQFFYLVFRWPVVVLNNSAVWIMRVVLRIEAPSEHDHVHSAEELRILVEQTEQGEDVTETEREILINALELNDLTVRDIMTPRNEVITFDVEKSFDENLEVAIESKHTRFPLVKDHLDNSLGLIHIKDVLEQARQKAPDLSSIRRELITVPELMPLDTLLTTFLAKHAHLALVVDEFGGALGLVMLDDVLEKLVGEIQDEFDEANDLFEKISDTEFVAAGALPLHELAGLAGLSLGTQDVSTVGGYMTHSLGHLPAVGESVKAGGYEATVTKAEERTVVEVRFKQLEETAEADAVSDSDADSDEAVEAQVAETGSGGGEDKSSDGEKSK